MLAIAIGIAGSLGAATSSGHVQLGIFLGGLSTLGVGVFAAASSLWWAPSQTRWEVSPGLVGDFVCAEAGRTRKRAILVRIGLASLVIAGFFASFAASEALHFSTNRVPVTCEVTVASNPTTHPKTGIVECFAPGR